MFAGIGGFRSGLEQAGHKCIGYIEWDKFARQSYQAMYDTKGEFTANDIQQVKGSSLPEADLWTFGSPCFVKGTLVQTNDGLIPIEKIKPDQQVVTIDGSLQKVMQTMVHNTEQIYQLKVEGNLLIQVTGNHPVFARKRRERHIGHTFDEPEWIKVKDLKKGDLIQQYNPKIKMTRRLTDEQVWLLGRYVADGYIVNTKRRHRQNSYFHRVFFCIGKKKVDYFKAHVSNYHLSPSVSNKNESCIKFSIHNKELMDLASEFGRGAANKEIPLWVFGLSLNQRKMFIDGYTSGDGSLVANKTMQSVTTISKKLALSFAKLVECTLNRPASVFYVKTADSHVIEGRRVNQQDQYQIHYRIEDNGKLLWHSKIYEGNMWKPVKTVKKIELDKAIPVFNLEVENNHTYNANGIICHNCTNISVAGNRKGLKGDQSRMFFEVIRLLKERIRGEKSLPKILIMENVKNLLSSNEGRDFAEVLTQMDSVGYDAEWSVFNSSDVVPQNRERVYIIGHLRGTGTEQVFPIQRQSKGSAKAKIKVIANTSKTNYLSHDIVSDHGISKTVDATAYKHVPQVAIHQGKNLQSQIAVKACLTPDRVKRRQKGRRFKENGEPAFTVTVADRHGVMLKNGDAVAIRKLTPRECWRLQGFSDEQFDKAKNAGVSNSQLYKQAGNAVTVPVVRAIGEKIAQNAKKEKSDVQGDAVVKVGEKMLIQLKEENTSGNVIYKESDVKNGYYGIVPVEPLKGFKGYYVADTGNNINHFFSRFGWDLKQNFNLKIGLDTTAMEVIMYIEIDEAKDIDRLSKLFGGHLTWQSGRKKDDHPVITVDGMK